MKNTTLVPVLMFALCGELIAAALTPAQKSYFDNRRIAVSRDTTTIPGAVITTWYRNGKPDTKAPAVVTNYLHKIVGAEQKNPLQALAEQWKATAEQWRTAATNNAARLERATAVLDEKKAEYVTKRDAATLPTTKAIYQAFIDAIDRIKASMNTADNNTTWYEKAPDGVNYIVHFPDGTEAMTCVHVGKPLSALVIPDYAVVLKAGGSL